MAYPAVSIVTIVCVLALVFLLGCLLDFPQWSKRTAVKTSEKNQMKKFLIIAALALFAYLISLTGCKKVDPKPCKEMQDSIHRTFRNHLIN